MNDNYITVCRIIKCDGTVVANIQNSLGNNISNNNVSPS